MSIKYRNSPVSRIEQFSEGSGVEVGEYEPGAYLSLEHDGMDGRPRQLNISLTTEGKFKTWVELIDV